MQLIGSMEDIDLRIWEYIDGLGSAEERTLVSKLVSSDAVWKKQYDAILRCQKSLEEELETEQPSLRFSQNIMEAIAVTTIAPATRKYINKWVIRGVAMAFLIPIAALLIYSVLTASWTAGAANYGKYLNIATSTFDKLFAGGILNIVSLLAMLSGLILLDALFRRQQNSIG
jgi:hypothetical protein